MEKAHKMQEKKKSISGRKTDKTGKPAIWQLRGRGFYAGNEKEEKNLQSVILDMVNRFGYLGILILIAVENVFPPIPSEVILHFGGFLTTCTRLHPAGVVLASTAGSLLGARVLYGAGTLVSPEGLAELLERRPKKLQGIRAEDAKRVCAELLSCLEEWKKNSISKEKLAHAKESLIREYTALANSPWGMVDFLAEQALQGKELTTERLLRQIERTEAADIVRAAKHFRLQTVYLLQGKERTQDAD